MNAVNNVSNNFTETDIDFNEFTIIAIFLEVKGRGWEVETISVVENDNNILISTLQSDFDNTVMTQPFSIIKIPRTGKTIIVE